MTSTKRFIHDPNLKDGALKVWDYPPGKPPTVLYTAATAEEAAKLAQELNNCEFEILGFYEEFIDLDIKRTLGMRPVTTLVRKLGSDGCVELVLTEPITLTKGMKQVVIKASKMRPVRVAAMLQILCGRSKYVSQQAANPTK